METTSVSIDLLSGFKRMSTKLSIVQEPETTGKDVLKLPWKRLVQLACTGTTSIFFWHTWYASLARWDTDFEVVVKGRRLVLHGQHSNEVIPEGQKERRDSYKERGCISHCFVIDRRGARSLKRESPSSFGLAIDFSLILLLYVPGKKGWRGRRQMSTTVDPFQRELVIPFEMDDTLYCSGDDQQSEHWASKMISSYETVWKSAAVSCQAWGWCGLKEREIDYIMILFLYYGHGYKSIAPRRSTLKASPTLPSAQVSLVPLYIFVQYWDLYLFAPNLNPPILATSSHGFFWYRRR